MNTTFQSLRSSTARIEDCVDTICAVRVLNHYLSCPRKHPEAPSPRPEFVRDFEREHGPAPTSAEVLLASVPNPGDWD